MEPELIFVPSAFKHGVTQDDIIHAFHTRLNDVLLETYSNKFGFVGFNKAGNPIEVFYNPIGEDKIKIFHAMNCRDGVLFQMDF
ncbi:MAG: hypothetical protein FWH12_09930 [Treponema sp.]|nr:hypothetical protein [Treponema sp.]